MVQREACVKISLTTIYNELQQTRTEIAEVKQKMDLFNNLMLSGVATSGIAFVIILAHVTGIAI